MKHCYRAQQRLSAAPNMPEVITELSTALITRLTVGVVTASLASKRSVARRMREERGLA